MLAWRTSLERQLVGAATRVIVLTEAHEEWLTGGLPGGVVALGQHVAFGVYELKGRLDFSPLGRHGHRVELPGLEPRQPHIVDVVAVVGPPFLRGPNVDVAGGRQLAPAVLGNFQVVEDAVALDLYGPPLDAVGAGGR